MDYARPRCLSFGTNSERGGRSGLRRSRGVAWSFVKGVDTTRGGRGWRRRYKPPASFTPPPLSFPPSSPGQNRGELCHRGCRTISRGLERRFGEDRAVGRNLGFFSPSSPLLTRGNRFLVELLTFVQRWSQTRIGKIFKGSKIMTEKSSSLYPLYPCKSASFVPLQSRNFLLCSLDKNR